MQYATRWLGRHSYSKLSSRKAHQEKAKHYFTCKLFQSKTTQQQCNSNHPLWRAKHFLQNWKTKPTATLEVWQKRPQFSVSPNIVQN